MARPSHEVVAVSQARRQLQQALHDASPTEKVRRHPRESVMLMMAAGYVFERVSGGKPLRLVKGLLDQVPNGLLLAELVKKL